MANPEKFESPRRTVPSLRISIWILLLFSGWGIFLCARMRGTILVEPRPLVYNVFYRLFYLHETVFFVMLATFSVVALAAVGQRAWIAWPRFPAPKRGWWLLAAIVVLLACRLGERYAMRDFDLSLDEYAAAFQARILAKGRIAAPVLSEWRPFAPALAPLFVYYSPSRQSWASTYLPVDAWIRSLFLRWHAEHWTNPALAALALVLAGLIGEKLWPGERARPWACVLFLATSSQFLLTSMTGFSMPALLTLDLLWLYLFARQDRAGWLLAPWVGAIALGVHNPVGHALFAAPFLLLLLVRRRFGWVAYFSLVYLPAGLGWWQLQQWLHPAYRAGGVGISEAFEVPGSFQFLTQTMNACLVFSWQTPVVALLLLLGLLSWRRLSAFERCLAAGVILTFGAYAMFPGSQGHGWGYRYIYGVLGNIVVLSAAVLPQLRGRWGRDAALLLTVSLAASVLIQLPVRLAQAAETVAPVARTESYLRSFSSEVVVVRPALAWYAQDLVRNDPFLRRGPWMINADHLSAPQRRLLISRYGARIHVASLADLSRFGIPVPRVRIVPDGEPAPAPR